MPNFAKVVASKKGIINYNPTNADYSNPYHSESGKFLCTLLTQRPRTLHFI